jgi:hypothetical protein
MKERGFLEGLLPAAGLLSCIIIIPDAESRLPKYQGIEAARLLIAKAGGLSTRLKDDIVATIYTNEGRQSLAGWMYARKPSIASGPRKGEIVYDTRLKVTDGMDRRTSFGRILQTLGVGTQDNVAMSKFVNLLFPCWTGTLTCFMTNPGESLAFAALKLRSTVEVCKWLLNVGTGVAGLDKYLPVEGRNTLKAKAEARGSLTNDSLRKVLGILFILEIIDDWRQLQGILDNAGALAPGFPAGEDPYDVVPVPNTGTSARSGEIQGDCFYTTLKNLIAIICDKLPGGQIIYDHRMNIEFGEFIRDKVTNGMDYNKISGETNLETHANWKAAIDERISVGGIPYNAAKAGNLAYALWNISEAGVLGLSDKGELDAADWNVNENTRGILGNMIRSSLTKLGSLGANVEVAVDQWLDTKLTSCWPKEKIIITDKKHGKIITIGA